MCVIHVGRSGVRIAKMSVEVNASRTIFEQKFFVCGYNSFFEYFFSIQFAIESVISFLAESWVDAWVVMEESEE